jgi:hypothetical protein
MRIWIIIIHYNTKIIVYEPTDCIIKPYIWFLLHIELSLPSQNLQPVK